ncbi:hypothetical protein LEP1GSC047_1098 [Leptospira inadai serovar Lyme str. 10]|uniref:Uncharacterized protein n=1 Tax=Leptospira inadai serovar Lyme str. 10 TaxID=1049790 RepID=V6H943_9LEPT|nr:hypothetical protein LEP1GSC047_1098 [Leptospira inadai serovar Lyme str. 10]
MISSGGIPAAINEPIKAPELDPVIFAGLKPISFKPRTKPEWAKKPKNAEFKDKASKDFLTRIVGDLAMGMW